MCKEERLDPLASMMRSFVFHKRFHDSGPTLNRGRWPGGITFLLYQNSINLSHKITLGQLLFFIISLFVYNTVLYLFFRYINLTIVVGDSVVLFYFIFPIFCSANIIMRYLFLSFSPSLLPCLVAITGHEIVLSLNIYARILEIVYFVAESTAERQRDWKSDIARYISSSRRSSCICI